MCDACNEQYYLDMFGTGDAPTHCEACGAPLTPEEQAAPYDPQYYRNCDACQTSRF